MSSPVWRILLLVCLGLQIAFIVVLHRPGSEEVVGARGRAKRLVSSDDDTELELQRVAQRFDLVKVESKDVKSKVLAAQDDSIDGDTEDLKDELPELDPSSKNNNANPKPKKPSHPRKRGKKTTTTVAATVTTSTATTAPTTQPKRAAIANHAHEHNVDSNGNTCSPVKRFIYLKTHKSGSSTLTNIFHRFAHNHNVPVALPKGNYFLGWPNSQKIPTCYVDLPDQPPQIWCSAHTRYNYELLDKVIPGATGVTVLRNPVSHFLSSWNYWRTEDHIAANHPTQARPTVEEFALNPQKWWPFAKKSDRDLLENNAAFDLGLTRNATKSDVEALIKHMEAHFALVLITEYMDESLVLLRRRFCWSLDDILYYGLKVTAGAVTRAKPTIAPAVKDAIRGIAWMDVILHDHFNRSLWAQIAKEKDFAEEVAEYRRQKDELHDQCVTWQEWTEDQHRKALLEGNIDDIERRCHLTQLDSAGFVRFLKDKAGIPDPECHTQGQPRRRVVFIKTHKTAGSTVTNIMHRVAVRLRTRVALPINNYYLGWPQRGGVESAVAPLPRAKGKPYEMFCSAHSRMDLPALEKLVPDAMFTTILRDPVKHFQSSWEYWHTAEHIASRRGGEPITLEEYVTNPNAYTKYMQPSDFNVLQNSMAFDLGLDHSPSSADVDTLISTMMSRFELVMITDYMHESLVMLRRSMCWTMDDIVGVALKVSQQSRPSVSPRVAAAIRRLNWADARLFDAFNATLWARIANEVHFETELAQFRAALAAAQSTCAPFVNEDENVHRRHLVTANLKKPTIETGCRMRMLDSPGFVKLLKHKAGIEELECHTQGRKRKKIAFIKTHKTGSSTVTNILHRFSLANNLRVVLPKDNLFLGWPYLDTLSSVQHYGPTKTYDVFASGHTRYNRAELQQLVPGAEYLTILRDPVAHFVSSWKHWHVADHIYDKGQPAPTMLEFVRNHEKYWQHTKWTDPYLVHNSMSFDLGLDNTSSLAHVDDLIERMDREFTLVMITELMDESLVLLRRTFCWSMDDILAMSLKVTLPAPNAPTAAPALSSVSTSTTAGIDNETRSYIEKMNAADMKLYTHFKSVLLARIAREVEFDSEVEQFRAAQKTLRDKCRAFVEFEEDRMRKMLLLNTTTADTRTCILTLLDSKGFVKHLKHVNHVPFPECSSSNILPLKQLAFVYPDPVVSSVFANVAARKAMRGNLGLVIPKTEGSVIDFSNQLFEVVGSSTPDMILTAPYEGEIRIARRFLPKVRTAYIFINPLERFARAWRFHNVADVLNDNGKPGVTITEFATHAAAYLPLLPADIAAALDNPMARRFGLRDSDKPGGMMRIAQGMYDSVDFFLPADNIDEGLVMLRRWMCWEQSDIVLPTAALASLQQAAGGLPSANASSSSSSSSSSSKGVGLTTVDPTGGLTAAEQAAVKAFLWPDVEIHILLSGLLQGHVNTLVNFEGELDELRAARSKLDGNCPAPNPMVAAQHLSLDTVNADVCQAAGLPVDDLIDVYRQ